MIKIITTKKQKEIDRMTIKKLRFCAKATLETFKEYPIKSEGDAMRKIEEIVKAMDMAEQIFYADDVINSL